MLWLIVLLLLLMWAGGFAFNLGALIHVLLVLAVIAAILQLTGVLSRRAL